MKRQIMIILGIVTLMFTVPFAAYSLEPMDNDQMKDVTGQAGVTIDITDLDVDVTMGEMFWADEEADNSGGRIVMSGVSQNIKGDVHTKIDTMTNAAGDSYIQMDMADTSLEISSMETTLQIADQAGNNAKTLGKMGMAGQTVTLNKCAVQISAH